MVNGVLQDIRQRRNLMSDAFHFLQKHTLFSQRSGPSILVIEIHRIGHTVYSLKLTGTGGYIYPVMVASEERLRKAEASCFIQ